MIHSRNKMKNIKIDLNKCKHLNGVSIEKRIVAMLLRDKIEKDRKNI